MEDPSQNHQGQRLLSAVERFVAAPELIIAVVRDIEQASAVPEDEGMTSRRRRVADGVVKRYSDNAAVAGAAAAVPAMLPGAGTLLTLTGGAMVDMALTLKYEVELALALAHVYGFDIHLEEERQRALLLAAVKVYEEKAEHNVFVELLEAQGTALYKYAPRQLSKLLLTVMGRLAVIALSRGFIRSIPMLGVVVGASVNKILTARAGVSMREQLEERRRQEPEGLRDAPDVVDAHIRS